MEDAILKLRQPNFDGVGAQLHRIFSAYAIAKKLQMPLQYDSIHEYDNQIFESNKPSLSNWNKLLTDLVPNFTDNTNDDPIIIHQNQRLLPVYLKVKASQRKRERTIHILDSPHTITNKFPQFFERLGLSKIPHSWCNENRNKSIVRIAIHLRRGELGLSQFKERYLPLSHYENILSQFIPLFETKGIPYEIIIPVEPGQGKLLNFDDPKVRLSLQIDPSNPNLIRVSNSQFRLNYEVPNFMDTPFLMKAKWIESGDAWEDFLIFLSADTLIMSKSSLSYIAALLNKSGTIIYSDFWHPKLSTWLSSKDKKGIRNAMSLIDSK